MHTGTRLFKYAGLYKKTILLALLMLAVAVSAELTGPYIAKQMIDTHIMGIEKPWYVTTEGKNTVQYQQQWLKREDRLEQGEMKGKEVRVLQVGRSFIFLNEPLLFDGERSVKGDTLTVTKGEQQKSYQVSKISTAQLAAFYRPEFKSILRLMAFYLGLLLLASVFQYGQKYFLQVSANRIIQKMRTDVFAQVQRLPIRYFDNRPAGKIVSRITNDTEAIRNLYVTVLATFFTSGIYISGIYAALFLLNARLAAMCLFVPPILYLWIKVYRAFASKYNQVIRARLSDINGMINESIVGMSMIRAFRRQEETKQEFEQLNEEYFRYENKMLSLNAFTSHNLANILRNVAFMIVIWYFGGASLGVGEVISFGVLYAFVDYLGRMFHPITGIVNQLAQLEQSRVAAQRVFELLDEEGIDVAPLDDVIRYVGNVKFENVTFAYHEQVVLKDISFEAKQGQTVALVGHTGSGKSSIMNLLFRFYEPKHGHGQITVDGVDIQSISKQHLRRYMGIVLQDPFLFTGTIVSNVSMGDDSISRDRVEQALRDVGAEQLLHHLPAGFDEPVIEKGSTLSAGQRQLISFARALAFNPAILILDEATASIDTESEAVIQQALEVLKKGRTTFVIAHRLSTIKNADQILVLDRGEIIERGSHEDLMLRRGKYYQMYQLQQGERLGTTG